MSAVPADRWRIGVLASRVGVTETVLRAWETRYGLLQPARTAAGYRLYGPEDERRARAMVAARARGVPAAQAAAEVLAHDRSRLGGDPLDGTAAGDPGDNVPRPARRGESHTGTADAAVEALFAAMITYDSAAMHTVLDEVLVRLSVESVICDVVLPFLHRVGVGWEGGSVDVADEHFASDVVRGRLAALSFGAGATTGPLALLACPPGEEHDIALKAFEVVLQRAGWRTRYLGPNTPVASIQAAADIIEPDVVVLAASNPSVLADPVPDLDGLARTHRVLLGGAGADAHAAERLGIGHLAGDPVAAATELARSRPTGD